MHDTMDGRYLDLMKKTLTFSLWPEPPVPIELHNSSQPIVKRAVVSIVARLLNRFGLQMVRKGSPSLEARRDGRMWPGYADTMIGMRRLENLQYCIESVIREGVQGDLIETGVWRGGACVFMRAALAAHGVSDRRVFVADSFEGLPKPDGRFVQDTGDTHHIHSFLAVSQAQVEENFRKFGLLDDQVVFLKGWFKDTLPTAPIERLSILRLDGDMYASTMDGLEHLYPKLSVGGYCIVDDYGAVPGCREAVEDYRAKHGITGELVEIDWTGRYWKKVN